jgi:beta-glucanase (GH16 family)
MRLHMDYEDFLKNNDKFESWYGKIDYDTSDFIQAAQPVPFHLNDDVIDFSAYGKSDKVNSPAHYTRGKQEAIDIIEEAIQDAPDVKSGMLQAQVLKYLLRLWLKDDPKQDAEKARWYLNRLIDKLDS